MARFLEAMQTWPWRDTVRTLRQRFREDNLGLTASSLTFTTTIALVPLATVTLAVFSAFPMFASFQRALEQYFLQSLVPDNIARPVLMALTQFAAKANRLGAVGLVFLLVTALALMLTIDRTLNNIWRVRTPRPIAQRVLVYWASATLGPLILGASLTLTSYAISVSTGMVGDMPGMLSFSLNSIEFVLLSLGMAGLFHYVPNVHVRWRHAMAGGLFVSIGVEVAKRGLAWYVKLVPTYSSVYGAFATVPIFLIWIYLGWVIVLLGAVIAAYAPSLSMRATRRIDAPGSRLELAVDLLRQLESLRARGVPGIDADALGRALRADPLQIEPVLDSLAALDWVGRLDEKGMARYVLLCDPATTRAAPLLSSMLLDGAVSLPGLRRHARLDEMSVRDLLAR